MAAKCIILCSFILLIISSIPPSFSQSNSQNIQTRYPLSNPTPPPPPRPAFRHPPATTNDPPNVPSTTPIPPPPQVVPSTTGKPSKKSDVGKAIGVTAASTLVLSGLLFFLLLRHSKRKRERDTNPTTTTTNPTTNAMVPRGDDFRRFNGNLKGLIVDENGLDVLYWRNLEGGDKRTTSFKKQQYRNLKDEHNGEEKRFANERVRKEEPLQEAPLLNGRSSTSESPLWGEKPLDQRMKKAPTVSSNVTFEDSDNHDSMVRVTNSLTPPRQPVVPPSPPRQPMLAFEAVPKGKTVAPPPQPSMLTPPLPPPPGAPSRQPQSILASGAVPKGKMPAPPPPPPQQISSNNGPVPPPPPPAASASKAMPGKCLSLAAEGSSSNGSGQVKLKPLHWDKVNPDVKHSMVWDKMDKGSFKFDGDLMEALFGYVATNRKSPRGDGGLNAGNGDKSSPPQQIFILEARKSQNIAIVLKSLGITRQELINGLLKGQGLCDDTTEKLVNIAPTDEELSQILAFHGDPTRLADAESFLYHLLKAVPSAFSRFNALLFKCNYDSEFAHIKESVQYLESACKEMKTRGLFLKLLEAVLKAGNRLNAGTSRGNAQAFNLTALTKLADVKSTDGKTTLLKFVVQEVVRAEGKRFVLNKNRSLSMMNSQTTNAAHENQNTDRIISKDDREREYMMLGLPVVGGLSAEFSNVKKAATLDYDLLLKTSSELAKQVVETRKIVAKCGNNGGFAREMTGFLDTAELDIQIVKEEQTSVIELVKKTTDYYQPGFSSKDQGANTFQLFIIVKDFLGMVDRVCIDIARNAQKKSISSLSPKSSSSPPIVRPSSPESPRVFRFPRLPANFMSHNSKSSSSDSDSGSEVK